jgi:hypothetical protein
MARAPSFILPCKASGRKQEIGHVCISFSFLKEFSFMAELANRFLCESCETWHESLPLSFSVKAPLAATRIPADELEKRVVITRDQCVIDGTTFFLRGRIVVPVTGLEEPFIWGVWAEVGPKNFIRTHDLWNKKGRESEPPFRGWLDTDLPLYGTTLNLEVDIKTQIVGRRPHFEIISEEHPLGKEQRESITLARVQEIATLQCIEAVPNPIQNFLSE